MQKFFILIDTSSSQVYLTENYYCVITDNSFLQKLAI